MTVVEKVEIVHKVLVDHQLEREVAREHRVGVTVVHRLARKAGTNSNFLQELISQRDERMEKR